MKYAFLLLFKVYIFLQIKATGLNRIYCGSELPPLVETTHSPLTLTLQLTQKEVGAGFKAIYTFVGKPIYGRGFK